MENVYNIGQGYKPWITFPKGKGIKFTIVDEAKKVNTFPTIFTTIPCRQMQYVCRIEEGSTCIYTIPFNPASKFLSSTYGTPNPISRHCNTLLTAFILNKCKVESSYDTAHTPMIPGQ